MEARPTVYPKPSKRQTHIISSVFSTDGVNFVSAHNSHFDSLHAGTV